MEDAGDEPHPFGVALWTHAEDSVISVIDGPSIPEQSRAEHIIKLGQLSVRSRRNDEVHTIALAGEMDLANAADVERELLRAEATNAARIVIDLSELTFMDSTGIRLLITAHARSRTDGDRLALVRPPARVFRVLTIAGVDGLLPFAD
jgi:stage II sporulation protein AA (anti-sigma F factor antagonist)